MKKLLLSSLAVAALSLGSSAFAATSTTTSFTVSVALTSTCRAGVVAGNAGVDFGTYTAFQPTAKTGVVGPIYSVDCTRNLAAAPTAAFDTALGTAAGDGVVAGLNYKLTAAAAVVVAGTAATAATSGQAPTGNGTATNYAFAITGAMPADQAGSVLNVGVEPLSAVTQSRSLIISF